MKRFENSSNKIKSFHKSFKHSMKYGVPRDINWSFNSKSLCFKHINHSRAYFTIQTKRQPCSKRGSSFVTQVDLTLQNWWDFKVLVTIGLNRLSSCLICTFYGKLYFLQFLISSWRFLRISGNDKRINFWLFFLSQESYSDPITKE